MQSSLSRRACLKLPLAAVASRLAADPAINAHGFKLGIITDELTGQLNEALDFLSSYHLRWCELREMWGKNIMNSSRDELDRARDLIERHGVRVSEIASPLARS